MKQREPLILVVDDEELIQVWMGERLRAVGYEVATSSTGTEARKMVAEMSPALVLLDLRLPDGDGVQFRNNFV